MEVHQKKMCYILERDGNIFLVVYTDHFPLINSDTVVAFSAMAQQELYMTNLTNEEAVRDLGISLEELNGFLLRKPEFDL